MQTGVPGIAQSTPTATAVSALVQAHYDLGEVVESEFLRRSFNQVYRLGFASGQRVVARLCAERPRGGPNLSFEAAALAHWAQAGCPVARCLPAASGEVAIQVPQPEGPRALMLFEHLDGEFTSDSAEDIEAFAQGQREAVFFDFDEAGPGYLAYELAVYPWSLYPRSPDATASDKMLRQWEALELQT